MKPVTVTTTIDRPREEIHAVLDDHMHDEAFTDHFLTGYQRTEKGIREKGYRHQGAKARLGELGEDPAGSGAPGAEVSSGM